MERETTVVGPSLARGPALVIGTVLSAFGLILLLKAGNTPTGSFPNGSVSSTHLWGIFKTNGWTGWGTTAVGAIMLFGAAQHYLAKVCSLLVGLVLAFAVLDAIFDAHATVLGLAAVGFWTALVWAIAAVLSLVTALAPRVIHRSSAVVDNRSYDNRVIATERPVMTRETPMATTAAADPVVVEPVAPRRRLFGRRSGANVRDL